MGGRISRRPREIRPPPERLVFELNKCFYAAGIYLNVGSRSPVILACGSSVLSTTLASSAYVVPFCHWMPTGGVITTPGAGALDEVKSIGPATASGMTTWWMASATSVLLCGWLTEVSAL